ncbi:MAG: cadmium-translocating P-type ATPase [Clostridia bacterium]|nr:cadmium-translocating P-type ATPase [Clostridia bacterium]
MRRKQKKLLVRILVSGALLAGAYLTEKLTDLNAYVYLPMYLLPYFIAGYDVLLKSARNIGHGKLFDECFLMTVATVGALIIGEYPESVFVMVFYQTGELFQSLAVDKSRRSIADLMDMAPDRAVRVTQDGEEEILPEEVCPGDTLLLRPGDRIPVDGVVLSGTGAIDTSALTGESVPADVGPGDRITSGCINLTGVLRMEASAPYGESAVAKILELVENSSLHKSRSEHFITKFARWYTPAVVLGAALLAVIPSVITREPAVWCYRALIFLVVSCPCALVISIPLSFFGGIGGASAKGILIKGANYLEALADVKTAVFDKTGTLTDGRFTVTQICPAEGITEEALLHLAASAEYYSAHPLAVSIKEAAKEPPAVPDRVTEHAGFGLEAWLDGHTVLAGNVGLLTRESISVPETETAGTAVYIAEDGRYRGHITLGDLPKQNAAKTVRALKKAGVKRCVMLTGDREAAAKETAAALGLDEVRAQLLPADKVRIVEDLCAAQGKGEKLFFVGDGLNDAPVLSRADVGFAMGALGSDAAIEAADVVLMDDDPFKIVTALQIAKKTRRIVRENVVFALGIKLCVLLLAALGLTSMWIGVFADVGVAVLAILNALRCLKPPKT